MKAKKKMKQTCSLENVNSVLYCQQVWRKHEDYVVLVYGPHGQFSTKEVHPPGEETEDISSKV